MPFTVDKLPNLPVVFFIQGGSRSGSEAPSALGRLIPLLDAQDEPVFLIMDLRMLALKLDEFSANGALRPDSLVHHVNVRETLIVSNESQARLVSQGLPVSGAEGARLRLFGAPQEALDYCRRKSGDRPHDHPRRVQTG